MYGLSMQAQNMREVFLAMPDSLQALLSRNNRMDMVDFLDNQMEAKITNRLEGQSVMDTLTADYLRITLTATSKLEMKLIQKGDDKQVVVIHTSAGPVKDSAMKCYTSDWKETEPLVVLPPFSAFLVHPREELTVEQNQILNGLEDMQLTTMHLSPENTQLVCELSLDILNNEEREKARSLVKPVMISLR